MKTYLVSQSALVDVEVNVKCYLSVLGLVYWIDSCTMMWVEARLVQVTLHECLLHHNDVVVVVVYNFMGY